jgi:hypothetical protein
MTKLGAAPEPFDGKPDKADTFLSNLENYFFLNATLFPDAGKKISSALTYFKPGTQAGEWARDRQKTALALTPVNFGTWADFITAFKKHFVPAEGEMEAGHLMYNTRMGNRAFNEWYQEWSNYASRAGVDAKTKMFAFRQNLPAALHQKILGVTPQPDTLDALAEKAREFDRLWRLYNRPAFSGPRSGQRDRNNVRSTTMGQEDGQSTQINLFTGHDQSPVIGKISKEEKDRRFKAKLCFYCGKPNHMAKDCRTKKSAQSGSRPGPRKDTKARGLSAQDSEMQEEAEGSSPSYEDQTHISRFYTNNRYEIIRPKSAPVNEDF